MAATAVSEVCTDFPDADQPRLDTLSADAHAAIAQQLATAADVLSLACVSGSLSASLAHELAARWATATQQLLHKYPGLNYALQPRAPAPQGCQSWHQRLDRRLVHDELLVVLQLFKARRDTLTLERLEIDGAVRVCCRSAAALARELPAAAPCLHSLSLSGCDIGDEGACALAEAIAGGGLPRLRALDMDENAFGGLGRSALRRACRRRGVDLSVASIIENESLFE